MYNTGFTDGDLGGPNAGSIDAFVSKHDADGNQLWTRQLGSMGAERSLGVSADGQGNVYISGYASGILGADGFVSKYNDAGNLLWTRQLGIASFVGLGLGVSADGLGNVYVTGYTGGDLGGPNAGSYDAFVSKYDSTGGILWTRQLGTSAGDFS